MAQCIWMENQDKWPIHHHKRYIYMLSVVLRNVLCAVRVLCNCISDCFLAFLKEIIVFFTAENEPPQCIHGASTVRGLHTYTQKQRQNFIKTNGKVCKS